MPLLGFSYEEILDYFQQKKASKEGGGEASGFGIEQLVIDGEVRGDVADLTAKYKIQIQSADWVTVPLMSGGPVLRDATDFHGSAEHTLQYDGQSGVYTAQLRGKPGSEQQISLKFVAPIKSIGGQSQIEMNAPSAAASELTIRVPEPAIELIGHRGAALAEVKSTDGGAGAQINCLGMDGPLTLAWRSNTGMPESRLNALDATGQILARIDGRHVQFDCRLTVSSLGSSFDKFHIKLPPETELSTIGALPTGYTLTANGKPESRDVEVQLPERTVGPVEVHLQAERPYDVTKPDQSLELAGFIVAEALPHRQSGQIAVAVEGDWQIAWGQQSRVRQIEETAEALHDKAVIAGFEYFGQPASLVVRVAPRKTRVIVEPEYQCFVDAHQARLQAILKYAIRGAKASSLDIAMPGWEIDELRPTGAVDVDAIPATSGAISTIQLTQPTTGELELTLKAHRELPTNAGRIDLPLPAPTADVVGPAILAVLPADNVRLRPRDADSQGLSHITVPPRMRLPVQQQPPLFYRAEQLPAVLVADLERIPQSVSVSVESSMELRRDAIRMEQRFRYKVEHESLNSITLDVPAALLYDTELQFEYDGQSLAPALPQSVDPEASTVTVDVPLPSPQLGTFEVVARYRLIQKSPVGEFGSLLTVPLLMPSGASLNSNNLTAVGDLAPRLQPHDELWTIIDDPQESTGDRPSVRLAAGQATSDIALAFTGTDSRAQGTTVVQREWVQTWISGSIRQDSAAYRFSSSADELEIGLPPGVSPNELEVRIDHEPLSPSPSISRTGTISIKLPPANRNQIHVLELRYQFANGPEYPTVIDVELPRFVGNVWVQRMYWQLVLPR